MSGKGLVTLENISYSRFQDTRLGPYAYGFAFDNRIVGYIKIPGMMELKPREGVPPLVCPYKSQATLREVFTPAHVSHSLSAIAW